MNVNIEIFQTKDYIKRPLKDVYSSVLLDASDEVDEMIIKKLLNEGTRVFFIFGKNAENIHEKIDSLSEENCLETITMTLDQEDMNDYSTIAYMFFNFETDLKFKRYIALLSDGYFSNENFMEQLTSKKFKIDSNAK